MNCIHLEIHEFISDTGEKILSGNCSLNGLRDTGSFYCAICRDFVAQREIGSSEKNE